MGCSHHQRRGIAPLFRSPHRHLSRIGRVATYTAIVCGGSKYTYPSSSSCIPSKHPPTLGTPTHCPGRAWVILLCHSIGRSNVKPLNPSEGGTRDNQCLTAIKKNGLDDGLVEPPEKLPGTHLAAPIATLARLSPGSKGIPETCSC